VRDLAVAEYLEGRGRFSTNRQRHLACLRGDLLGYPAHLSAQKAGSDCPTPKSPSSTFAAETASLLG
jgi:hypothetical protein